MAPLEIIDLNKLPREEAIEKAMKILGFSRSDAEFYIAMGRGEVDGDIIKVDDEKDIQEDPKNKPSGTTS